MAKRERLTEKLIKAAEAGKESLQIFDEEVRGFAVRIRPTGGRVFTLDYRMNGRQLRYTIGRWPEWTVTAARERAKALRREIDAGEDPLAEREVAFVAPRIVDLIDRYITEHVPRLSRLGGLDQISVMRGLVQPHWEQRLVTEITSSDVERLLAYIAEGRPRPSKKVKPASRRTPLQGSKPTPVRANRVGEIIRKMFTLAIAWKMRTDNPASGFYRRVENERERFLTVEEIGRLADTLAVAEDQRAATIIRMCFLTGARLGEVRTARFEQFNLELQSWSKPATTTKQRKTHRLPVSADVIAVVRHRQLIVPNGCPWLFPGNVAGKPVQEVSRFWDSIRAKADLPGFRIHDLRHTFASLLVSGGSSLEMIGKLLGHSQAKTTQRYAHLIDSPLRAGVNAVADAFRTRPRLVGKDDAA